MSSMSTDPTTSPEKQGSIPVPNLYGWWFAECPRHGRTPHLSLFGGFASGVWRNNRPERSLSGEHVSSPPANRHSMPTL
jgi:hypothetical protein